MDFLQLTAAFENYTGVSQGEVDPANLALWFNEAQLDLSYDLGERVSRQYYSTGKEPQDLPDDALRVLNCQDNNGLGVGYQITPLKQIVFDNDGVYTLFYIKTPTDFTGVDDSETSQLDKNLHYLIAMFAASRYWEKEGEGDLEESALATKWYNYYYNAKNIAIEKMNVLISGIGADRWIIED